jgi:hypothetical protein
MEKTMTIVFPEPPTLKFVVFGTWWAVLVWLN